MMGIIYLATNKTNGKKYVGQTIQLLKKRIAVHFSGRTAFSNALRKYGTDGFFFEVIDNADSLAQLNEKEAAWISAHNCMAPNGYNLRAGGTVASPTPETRLKMSLAKKGKPSPFKGKTRPGLRGKRRPLTPQHNKILQDARIAWNVTHRNPWVGKKHSAESRERMSAAKVGKGYGFQPGHVVSERTREIVGARLRGKKNPWIAQDNRIHPKHTTPHSEESKRKMSESRKKNFERPEFREAFLLSMKKRDDRKRILKQGDLNG